MKINKIKKGELAFETIVKLAIILIVLVSILLFIFLLKDKSAILFEKIKNVLRFGLWKLLEKLWFSLQY